ncbi:MAG: LamG domain-containing protein [Pirellulaceae bacterium]
MTPTCSPSILLLGPLQYNGGFTPTHALDPSSPAIDATDVGKTYAEAVLAFNPLVYYPLDETSGIDFADASGNGTDAVAYPTPPNNPGLTELGQPSLPGLGTSPSFTNGIPVSSIQVPDLGTHSQLTIEAWVKPQSRPEVNDFDVIYNSRNFNTGAVHLQFTESETLRFTVNGAGEADFGSAADFPLNQWTHVVATYDNGTDEAQVYVNGELLSTATFGGDQDAILSVADIGTWNASVREFDGQIDEFAIYAAVMPPARIVAHYNAAFISPADQRGGPFTRYAGSKADIGAFEFQAAPYDFGDALTSFPVTESQDGARHFVEAIYD